MALAKGRAYNVTPPEGGVYSATPTEGGVFSATPTEGGVYSVTLSMQFTGSCMGNDCTGRHCGVAAKALACGISIP